MNEISNCLKVEDDELLTRFIKTWRHIRSSNNTVKHEAFMPHSTLIELSVFRHIGLTQEELWKIGHTQLARPIYGRADIYCYSVKRQNLTVEPNHSLINHANIKNWPTEKAQQKIIAMVLASEATLILCS